MSQTPQTKYFSGETELKGAWPERKERIRPTGLKVLKIDSFSVWVGTENGLYHQDFLPVTRIVRHNPHGSLHKCDARCENAKGGNCECSCGGKNHGKNR